jgi:FAD/FMN-containing dehydrogenase
LTVDPRFLDTIASIVPPGRVYTGGEELDAMSRDFFWLSPILSAQLHGRHADVAVKPTEVSQVPAILAAAYEHRVPVTPRGRGTGNYGQAVPLRGGLVLDLTGCAAIAELESDDTIWVEAGVSFAGMEKFLNELDREVAVMPSTVTSTIGGFLAGGNQGLGSIEFGSTWDGWVRALTVVPCTADPAPATVPEHEVPAYTHSYGTTGVITAVRVATAVRRDRTVVFGAFDTLSGSWSAGMDLMQMPEPPRALAIDDRAVYQTFWSHAGLRGDVVLRVMTHQPRAAEEIIRAHGGTVTAVDASAVKTMTNSIYNHTTLRVHQADTSSVAIQIRGRAIVDHEAAVRAVLPNTRIHLDGNAPKRHGRGFSGLLYSDWVNRETLDRGMEALRKIGVLVVNPHTWLVGSHGEMEKFAATARTADPLGLLNPGKLVHSESVRS